MGCLGSSPTNLAATCILPPDESSNAPDLRALQRERPSPTNVADRRPLPYAACAEADGRIAAARGGNSP